MAQQQQQQQMQLGQGGRLVAGARGSSGAPRGTKRLREVLTPHGVAASRRTAPRQGSGGGPGRGGRGRGSVPGGRGKGPGGWGGGRGRGAGGGGRGGGGRGWRRPLPPVRRRAPGEPLCELPRTATLGLTAEQAYVLRSIAEGASVFMTGPGGTGKTHTIRALTAALTEAGVAVAVTAASGIAATHIEGATLHAWAGLGRGMEPLHYYTDTVAKWARVASALRSTEVLVVDEISMLGTHIFTILDAMARTARGVARPMGGMVLLLSGDFFQLPPVLREDARPAVPTGPLYASEWWASLRPRFVELGVSFRQRNGDWAGLLNRLRTGDATEEDHAALEARVGPPPPLLRPMRKTEGGDPPPAPAAAAAAASAAAPGAAVATALHARRVEVAAANAELSRRYTQGCATVVASLRLAVRGAPPRAMLVEISTMADVVTAVRQPAFAAVLQSGQSPVAAAGPAGLYDGERAQLAALAVHVPAGVDAGPYREALRALRESTVAPRVTLALGMPVVLLTNVAPPTLVNGSQGVVTGWAVVPAGLCVTVGGQGGAGGVEGTPVPPWGAPPTPGARRQVRIAAARHWDMPAHAPCQTGQAADAPAARALRALQPPSLPGAPGPTELVPVVQFASGPPRPVLPHFFCRRLAQTPAGHSLWGGAWQVPLAPAGALTIHKAQGMSMDAVHVDPRGVFEAGQLYVAVSRVRTRAGLTLAAYDPSMVRADAGVKAWYAAQRAQWTRVAASLEAPDAAEGSPEAPHGELPPADPLAAFAYAARLSEAAAPGPPDSAVCGPAADSSVQPAGPSVPAAGPRVPAAGPSMPAANAAAAAAGPKNPAAPPPVPGAGPTLSSTTALARISAAVPHRAGTHESEPAAAPPARPPPVSLVQLIVDAGDADARDAPPLV